MIPVVLSAVMLAAAPMDNVMMINGASAIVGLANPWTEYSSMEDAGQAAGFDFELPDSLGGYGFDSVRVMNKEIIQADFADGDSTLTLRKGITEGDISGDYNTYKNRYRGTIGGVTVHIRANGEEFSTAVWEKDGYSYSCTFSPAVSKKTMVKALKAVISTEGTSSAGLANPWTEYSSMEDAEQAAGFGFELPDSLGGYEFDTARVMNKEIIQADFADGDSTLTLRKGITEGDISGDYNTYKNRYRGTIGGVTVHIRANGEEFSTAVWEKDGYKYSCSFSQAVPRKTMVAILKQLCAD